MENKKLENKFAMHLSGVLEGMGIEKGIDVLRAIVNGWAYVQLDSVVPYENDGEFSLEIGMSICNIHNKKENLLKEYGIHMVNYVLEIEATDEEIAGVLEKYDLTYSSYDCMDDVVEDLFKGADYEKIFNIYNDFAKKFEKVHHTWWIQAEGGRTYENGK